jgi:tight adherence protein G
MGRDTFNIQTVATASATAFATFEIGSTLVSVNGGLINQILGQMLGTFVSLSAMDYQSLISANIDMFSFMNALATRMNVTGVTYTSLLSGNAKVGTVINAMIDSEKAASGMSAAVSALSQVASALNGSMANVPLSALVNPGAYGAMTVGQTPSSTVSISTFNLLEAAAGLANGTNQVAASLNLGLPGIASISMLLAIGQPPVGTSWVTVGSVGASVYTAQTRLLLTVQLLGTGGIASVKVPIYVNLASGSATLNAVQCGNPSISNSSVTLGVTPGIVDSWIGNVTASDFSNLSTAPQPGPATLVSAAGISVTGLAHVAMNNMSPTPVTFSYSDIQAQTGKTVNTTSYTSSLVSQLLSSLSLNVSVGGLGLGLPSVLTQTVGNIISAQTAPLDQVLSSILATVGVSVGQATVWVTGVRCDGAVLVN